MVQFADYFNGMHACCNIFAIKWHILLDEREFKPYLMASGTAGFAYIFMVLC